MSAPSTIDLTKLDAVKAWVKANTATTTTQQTVNESEDDIIQDAITAFSRYVLVRAGKDSFLPANYSEIYDGNGSFKMRLRNDPIRSVSRLLINGVQQAISSGYMQRGIFITQDKKFIAIRPGGSGAFESTAYPVNFSGPPFCFARGLGNILAEYEGGYDSVPEDLEMTSRRVTGLNYRRRDHIDIIQTSLNVSGGQSTQQTFRAWDIPPEDEKVLRNYIWVVPV